MTPAPKVIVIKPTPTQQPQQKERAPIQAREKTILQRIAEIVVSDIKSALGIQERRISSQEIQRGIESTLRMVRK